jgi:alkyl hydroperoxide reductase subunit F
MIYETIIIGAGIAGCTAAIYAARNRMDFLLLTKEFGGQFLESDQVLNYPGIVQTTGAEFASTLEKQLKFNGVKINDSEEVKEIKRKGKNFLVLTNKREYETQTVIIATGARARKLLVKGEDTYAKNGVYYCAICDGPLLAGKDVAIVGGGNSALEAADFMRNIAKKIYVINIGDKFIAHKYLIDRVTKMPNAQIITNAKTTEIFGAKTVHGLRYETEGRRHDLQVQGVIVEAGRSPNTEFVKGLLELDEHDHIKIDCQTVTSVPGIFAAGDCSSVHEYQYAIAAGQGCAALLKAHRYISNGK